MSFSFPWAIIYCGELCCVIIQEVREAQLAKEKAEDEYRELADAVEMATLDKEMAEERVSPWSMTLLITEGKELKTRGVQTVDKRETIIALPMICECGLLSCSSANNSVELKSQCEAVGKWAGVNCKAWLLQLLKYSSVSP